MEQSPSRVTNQEIIRLLWNHKVHYCVHNSLPLIHILSQMNPVHNLPPSFLRSILILFSYLRRGLPSGPFSSGFPTKIFYAFRVSPMRATCPVHVNLLDLITLIFGEAYKL
jgi:hypothetical protein